MKNEEFEGEYFTSGNWVEHKTFGIFTTYYWARKFYARIIKRQLKKGKILEIGCGYGDLLSNFGENYEVYGVEISKFACKEAKRRNPRLNMINKDALKYLEGLTSNYLDAIIQICVIPHMDDPPGVIKEISRTLKKGGYFLSVVPNPDYPLNRLKGNNSAMYIDKTHKHLYSVGKWINLVKQNDFEIVKMGSTGLWDVPYLPVIPKILQLFIFGWPSMLQIFLGNIFLPSWLGVDLILLARKLRESKEKLL